MISTTYKRYIWLLRTLLQHKRMTFEEISQAWEHFYMSDGRPLTKRTFHLHRKAVSEMFSVFIHCDSSDGYRYYVKGESSLRKDRVLQGLLQSFPMENAPAEKVILRVYGPQVQELRSQPIHISQKEVERNEGCSIFEYSLTPSQDLTSQLLAMGDNVEVLAPKSLRKEMKEKIISMYNRYKK